MASIHNAIKYGTTLLRGFSRGVGLDEMEEGTVRLGETLTPVMDFWSRPEWAFLRGEELWTMHVVSAAPAAGQHRRVRIAVPLRVPPILLVVELIKNSAVSTIDVRSAADVVVGAAVGTLSRRDGRGPPGVPAGLAVSEFDVAPGQPALHTIAVSTNDETSWVISPQTNILLTATVANLSIDAVIAFRIRHAFPGEL